MYALNAPIALLFAFAIAILGGCFYKQECPPEAHFEQFSTKPPKGDRVTVCHAYGCKAQTPFTFSP